LLLLYRVSISCVSVFALRQLCGPKRFEAMYSRKLCTCKRVQCTSSPPAFGCVLLSAVADPADPQKPQALLTNVTAATSIASRTETLRRSSEQPMRQTVTPTGSHLPSECIAVPIQTGTASVSLDLLVSFYFLLFLILAFSVLMFLFRSKLRPAQPAL